MNVCTRGVDSITKVSKYCSNCGVNQNITLNKQLPYQLPSDLMNNQGVIAKGLVGVQKTQFDPGYWNIYVTGYSNLVDNLGVPDSLSYKLVSRDDVTKICKNVIQGGNTAEELFIASQIWGWGTGGRGMSHTAKATNSKNFTGVINDVFSLVIKGEIRNAYDHMKLDYCGAAYISKFLYFAALGAGITPVPVILDGRVVNSLIQIGAHEGWLAKTFSDFSINSNGDVFVEKNSAKYVEYIDQMDIWAKALGCPADFIEYYLWSTG
jgi:hypothetical protein